MIKTSIGVESVPLCSVIMNCYNSEIYLKEAVSSVIDQNYTNWEVIFWDNQSTDRSAAILKGFQDRRIKYFYAASHTPLGVARNLALEKAQGKYIAFLDCDDKWMPDKLLKQIHACENDPAIVLSYTVCKDIISDGTPIHYKVKSRRRSDSLQFSDLIVNNSISWQTVLIRADILKTIGGFNNAYQFCEDYDIILKAFHLGKFHFVNEPLSCYRIHPNNESHRIKYRNHIEVIDIMHYWLNKIPDNSVKKLINNQIHFQAFSIRYELIKNRWIKKLFLYEWKLSNFLGNLIYY